MTSARPREWTPADTAARLFRAMRLWTAAAGGSAVLFGLGLTTSAGNPLSPGTVARLLLLLQPIVSIGFPVALVMVARAMSPAPVIRIWAWVFSAVSGAAWVTYDLANLHRLMPLMRSHVLAGISIPAIVPFGWWIRNLEILGSAVLICWIATIYGHATKRGRRAIGVLTGSMILAVLVKSTVLLIFQQAAARGERKASAYALFVGISLLSQLVQHVTAVAAGALGAKQLRGPRLLGPLGPAHAISAGGALGMMPVHASNGAPHGQPARRDVV